MTPPQYDRILQRMDNAIYQELFGMGKNDMIRAAFLRHPTGWGDIWGDNDDENMRDCLSAQALEALAAVECDMARRLGAAAGSLDQIETLARQVARRHKPANFQIWSNEPDGKAAE